MSTLRDVGRTTFGAQGVHEPEASSLIDTETVGRGVGELQARARERGKELTGFESPRPASWRLGARVFERSREVASYDREREVRVLAAAVVDDARDAGHESGSPQAHELEKARVGEAPDCANVDSFTIPLFIEQGVLQPIDDYLSQEQLDDLFPYVRDVMTGPDDHVYAWWWSTDLRVIYRRTDLVPDAPTTWDELIEFAKEAERKDPKVDGYTIWNYTGLHASGTDPPVVDGSVTFDDSTMGIPWWPLRPGAYVVHYLVTDRYRSIGSATFEVTA